MTIEQLKQFVADRIYTNNNFEVSAIDVQEAINQVIDELFARETPDTPTLQQVLDEGNSANLDTLLEVVLTKVGQTLRISSNNIFFEQQIGDETQLGTYSSSSIRIEANNTNGSNSFLLMSPVLYSTTFTNNETSYSRLNGTTSENWFFSNSANGQNLAKQITIGSLGFEGGDSLTGEGYKLLLNGSATFYEISAGDDISSRISIHKADTVNTVNGTRGLVLSTKISADQTNDTEAAICIDGDLQIINIEEEVVTDYSEDQDILIKDSNGVVKSIKNQNSPFIINEVLIDSDTTSSYDANLFDFIFVEGSSSQVDILLPSVLFNSYGYRERNLVFYVSNRSSQNVFVRGLTGIFDTLVSGESAEYRYHTIAGEWVVISSNRV